MSWVTNRGRIKAEMIDRYEQLHNPVPAAVAAAIMEAGVKEWLIWRDGVDLYQLFRCDDWAVTRDALARLVPADWVVAMRDLSDRDFMSRDNEVRLCWRFADGEQLLDALVAQGSRGAGYG